MVIVIYVVVQIFIWVENVQTSLIFIFLSEDSLSTMN